MAALKTAKRQLRTLMHKELSLVPEASVTEQSKAIYAKILSLPKYKTATRVGIYLSMPKGEVSTRSLVLDAIAQGKQVFVPYIYDVPSNGVGEKSPKIMEMVSIRSREDYENIESNRDAWSIPSVEGESVAERNTVVDDHVYTARRAEKNGSASKTLIKQSSISKCHLDMVFMPGLAFDQKCGRLGHGKGFYDKFLQRYLEKIPQSDAHDSHRAEMPFLVGLALNEQVTPDEEIPRGPLDWRLDMLITGEGNAIERPTSSGEPNDGDRKPHQNSVAEGQSI